MLYSCLPIWACDFNKKLENLELRIQETKQVLNHESLDNIHIVKQHITLMTDIDQIARKLFIKDQNNEQIRQIIQEIDRFHTTHLKAILEIHHWISISRFGKEADNQAWLLVQHADHDPAFQVSCLAVLEPLVPLEETDKKNYAYLYDRTAPMRGLKQRFGTQVNIDSTHVELLPYEGTLENVNKCRKEIGLEPVELYLQTIRRVYH